MSTPADYLRFLSRNGVKLWIDNGQLRYHARKGVLGPEELARLQSMKGEIVAELIQARVSEADKSIGTDVACVLEAPVSFQQRWFLKLLDEYPNWKATLSYLFHLKGVLDPRALEMGLAGVLHKHSSLRTRIVRTCGAWRQQIEPSGGFRLPINQVAGESDAERQQNAPLLIQKAQTQSLDPAAAGLMTAQLIRLSAQEHFLVVMTHRLATDCFGIGQAFRDLWTFYAEAAQQGSSTSLEGSTQYRDYSLWQYNTDEAWRQKHEAYWNDYLAGAVPLLWRLDECAPPASRNGEGELASLESSFGETLSARLRELSRQTRILPALIMLTLYVACLSIWCKQKDLVVPFLIAGRAAAHEGVVGCFSHVVYLRVRLRGNESFIELLKLVSNEYYRVAAFRQDSGRMAIERPELVRGTLCQWLSWHPADIAGLPTDSPTSQLGLKVENVRCQSLEELTNIPPDRVDLEINFFDAAGGISALAIYRTGRFGQDTLRRLMGELRSVAERAVKDSGAPIAR